MANDNKPQARVKPGEQLRYVDKLRSRDRWPPKRGITNREKYRSPAITPYVVVIATPSDQGIRPLPDNLAHFNDNIQIEDPAGHATQAPTAGPTYRIRASVANRGGCGAFG